MGPDLRPFQREGVGFLRNHERAILGDDPGLGKSAQALRAAVEPVLIVGPAALEGTWDDEVALWTPDLDYGFCSYSMTTERTEDTRGRMTKVTPYPHPDLLRVKWGTIVCDEAHYLKGRKTNWSLAVERLFRHHTGGVALLTGSPVPNWAHEIYMLLRLLRPEGVDLSNYWRWINRWFKTWKPPWGGTQIRGLRPDRTWEQFIRSNQLDRLMLRRTRDEVLTDLPPLTIAPPIDCPMLPVQAKVYAELKRDFLADLPNGDELLAWSDGALQTRLMQVSFGLEALHMHAEREGVASSGKLAVLAEILAERRHSPTLIGCVFRASAEAVAAAARRLGIKAGVIHGGRPKGEADTVRRQFQAGELGVVVGTLAKLSEGMTFTRADTAILAERSWRSVHNEQFMRRIHRMGQQRPCTVLTLITPKTVDAGMTRLLDRKESDQFGLLRAHQLAQILDG